MSLIRSLIEAQKKASLAFDRLLPAWYRVDGNSHFAREFAPRYALAGMTVYDVGGGKHPFFGPAEVRGLGLHVVGIDIDQGELDRAPAGAYGEAIQADITEYRGRGDADLVVCRALLEHVSNAERAFAAIASILRPGGRALIFVPSRNAVFARLNLVLPEGFKRRLLFGIHPSTEEGQGFPSYYDRCTPRDFRRLGLRYALDVEDERLYYRSMYLSFFLPAHVAWRMWLLAFRALAGAQAAETFAIAFRKTAASEQEAETFAMAKAA